MLYELTNIPERMQTRFFKETYSVTIPEIFRECDDVLFPAFIRVEQFPDDNGGTRTQYRYFMLRFRYEGERMTDYQTFAIDAYAKIRSFFYGTSANQAEMQSDNKWEGHRLAVRQAFPKVEGEIQQGIVRFEAIKDDFWAAIDAACAAVGCTRADLPAKFTAEEMLAFATLHGMSTADIATYTAKISITSMNLLQNQRNWDELFD